MLVYAISNAHKRVTRMWFIPVEIKKIIFKKYYDSKNLQWTWQWTYSSQILLFAQVQSRLRFTYSCVLITYPCSLRCHFYSLHITAYTKKEICIVWSWMRHSQSCSWSFSEPNYITAIHTISFVHFLPLMQRVGHLTLS